MCCSCRQAVERHLAPRCPSCRGIAQKTGPVGHPFAQVDCSAEAAHTFTRVHETPWRICFHLTVRATCTDHKSWGSSEPQNLKSAAGVPRPRPGGAAGAGPALSSARLRPDPARRAAAFVPGAAAFLELFYTPLFLY